MSLADLGENTSDVRTPSDPMCSFLFIMMKIGQKLNWSPQFKKSWIHHSNITLQTDVKLYLLNVVYCVILLNKPFITTNCFSLFVMISQLIIILWNVIFYLLNSTYLMVKYKKNCPCTFSNYPLTD